MVRFTPTEPRDPRSEEELYRDINSIMPFEIEPGDFVMNKRLEGPSCWVSFGDEEKTKVFVKALKSSPDWRYCSSGQILKTARASFGLAPEPGSYLAGISHDRTDSRMLARVDR